MPSGFQHIVNSGEHYLRYWLSYCFPFPVEKEKSSINPYLGLYYHRGTLQLQSTNCIYSYGRYYTSFRYAFQKLKLADRPIQKVLMLGFGLGSLVKIFKSHGSLPEFTGVEIDPKVIQLAQKYLSENELSRITLIEADAYSFVKKLIHENQQYDLVAMDVFLDDKVPKKFEHPDFIDSLRQLLQPDGLLLFNQLNNRAIRHYFKNIFSSHLPHSQALSVNGNQVLVCDMTSSLSK